VTAAHAGSVERLSSWSRRALSGPGLLLAVPGFPLLCMTVVSLCLGVLAALRREGIDYGEGIVYDHAARIVRGEPLYQPLNRVPHSVAAYTPVYYVCAAVMRMIFGPGLGPGRALSLAAGVVTLLLVWRIAARRAQDWRAGCFAALILGGLGLPPLDGGAPWTAVYRVDTLALALSVASIALLDGGAGWRRLLLSATLAGLAVLTKQTYLAAAAAGTIYLVRSNRSKGFVFGAATLTVVAAVCAGLELSTTAFLSNTVSANQNPISYANFIRHIDILLRFQAGPLAVVFIYLIIRVIDEKRFGNDLLCTYWMFTTFSVLGMLKIGSSFNYWMELAASTSILSTIIIWRTFQNNFKQASLDARLLPGLPVLIMVAVATPIVGESALHYGFLRFRPWPACPTAVPVTSCMQTRENDAIFDGVLARVRAEPLDVMTGFQVDVVSLSGKRIVFEPAIFTILYSQGYWDASPFVRYICGGNVGLLVINHDLEAPPDSISGVVEWPEPVLAALRQVMVLEQSQNGRFVYAARRLGLGDGCSGGVQGG
jgi:hypothetical protein